MVLQSFGKNYVSFSDKISEALVELKEFNYRKIYKSEKLKTNHSKIKQGFNILFEHYLKVLENMDNSSELFFHFLDSKTPEYKDNNKPEIIDIRTFGRSEEWQINVLRNNAKALFNSNLEQNGKHVLKIYAVNPSIILDRFVLYLKQNEKAYGLIPETKFK